MENQLTLIDVPPTTAPKVPLGFYKNKNRPNRSSPEVLIMVVNELLSQVMQWGSFTDDEETEISEQLLKAFKSERDGYFLAKYLDDRFSWNCDSELVDILGDADFYGATRTAVMAWIKDNDKKAIFFPGRLVEVLIPRDKTRHEGVITKVYEDGNYCVMIPKLGHVAQGNGTHGMIFTWEEVEGWNLAESV